MSLLLANAEVSSKVSLAAAGLVEGVRDRLHSFALCRVNWEFIFHSYESTLRSNNSSEVLHLLVLSGLLARQTGFRSSESL